MMIFALPLIAVLALGTAITLRTSPFFVQQRLGQNGVAFRLVKLRTLPKHTPKYASKTDLHDIQTGWFSAALRRTHLDELPQLMLVLTGKMSLVGPRPEMEDFYKLYDDEFARLRLSVRPGCTGLWQISPHSTGMIFDHPEYDLHYVRRHGLRLDLWILVRTLWLMIPLGASRVTELAAVPTWTVKIQPNGTKAPSSSDGELVGTQLSAAPATVDR
jgi:lipopolysaccharide/colanic/teichoic acid biosynthesis glycosyltransferase